MIQKFPRNDCRTVTLCIDGCPEGIPCGRFYSASQSGYRYFNGLAHFLIEMEKLLNETDAPKAFSAIRTFQTLPPGCPEAEESAYSPGAVATFIIRILFRQNVSWQGAVSWLEGQQEQSFRSVLELLVLVDSALSCRQSA